MRSGCSFEHDRHSSWNAPCPNIRATPQPHTCPFCRETISDHKTPQLPEMFNKRLEANDVDAMYNYGKMHMFDSGDFLNIEKNTCKAAELFERAAELGCAEAWFNLGYAYREGDCKVKDEEKGRECWEKGAMAGCSNSRYNLAGRSQCS
jgi:TPR repeat protein